MDEKDKINQVRAVLNNQSPNVISSYINDTSNVNRTFANNPTLQTREMPPIDRTRLATGGLTPDIQQRMVANNTKQSLDALARANATAPLVEPAPKATPQTGRIAQFFNSANNAIQPLNKPLVTAQGVKNTASTVLNSASKLVSNPATSKILTGAGQVAGAVQAVAAGNELINGNGNLLQKADNAINVGLGTGTAFNPIVGVPNLAYQAAKAGGGLITDFANKLGLLDGFKQQPQAQTAQFAEAEKKFLANKAQEKLAQTTVKTPQNTAQAGDNSNISKPMNFDNLTPQEQAAIVRDMQQSGATSATLNLQGADGKMNTSTLAVPKAPAPRKPSGVIQNAFAPQAAQNTAQPVQEVLAQEAGNIIENPPQETFENPLLSLTDEELANTPTFEGVDSKGRYFMYPNGKRIDVPANRKPEDVIVGYGNYEKYKQFLASQNNGGNQSTFTNTGQQVFNPVRVISGLQDSVEGFDANGVPLQGIESQQVAKRDAEGNVELDTNGRPTYINDFAQQRPLTDAEKVQLIKNDADIQSATIQADGRIAEQNIQSGANNEATRSKQALIDEYFNPKTTPERRKLIAPLVTGATTSKGFKDVTRKNSLGEEEVFILNQDTGDASPVGQQSNAQATSKPSLSAFLAKAKQANPNVPEAELVAYYNQTYGN